MKSRTTYFLSDGLTDEQLDYIRELHAYLWRVVRAMRPGASGSLDDFLDDAMDRLEKLAIEKPTLFFQKTPQDAGQRETD